MPRTTNIEYLQRHYDLQQLWLRFPEIFIVLSPTDQWRVHGYYQTRSVASQDQLLGERDRLGREQPSLPQAAGKAYHQLNHCFQIASHYGEGDPMRFFRAAMALTASEQARRKQQTGISITEAQREATDQDLDQAA